MVGRDDELAVLAGALDDARGRATSVVVVRGPSGVGKSRLVAAFADLALAKGARVLAGQCLEVASTGLPFGPIAAVLRDLQRSTPRDRLDDLLGPARSELMILVPELGSGGVEGAENDRRAGTDGEDPRAAARLFEQILGTVERLGEDAPTVIAIEDVQWIDDASRDVLSFLLHGLRSERVLLLLTFRSEHLSRTHPVATWLGDLGRTPRARVVTVPPLTAAQTGTQVEAILGAAPSPEIVERIHTRSEGNPLFTEALLASTADGSGDLPNALFDALLATVHRLPAGSLETVRAAAVAARPVDEQFLAAVLGGAEADYLEPVRDAVVGQVLVAGREDYAFRHGLFAEAIVADLTPGERRTLHARIAAALDHRPELAEGGRSWVAGESADHWQAAGRVPEAFRRSVDAALAATGIHAYQAAARRWEAALEIADHLDTETRSELLTGSGLDNADLLIRDARALGLTGAHERAVELADRALGALEPGSDAGRVAQLRSDRARILWEAGRFDVARDAQHEAAALLEAEAAGDAWAAVMTRYATMLLWQGRVEEAIDVAGRAAVAARAHRLAAVEAQALEAQGIGLRLAGSMADAVGRLTEARRLARSGGDLEEYLFASDSLTECLVDADRFDEAVDVAAETLDDAVRSGLDRPYGAMFRGNGALALFHLGRWAEADLLTSTGIDVGHGRIWALAVRARLMAAMGRPEEVRVALATVASIYPDGLPAAARLERALPAAELLLLESDPAAALEAVVAAFDADAPHVGLRLDLATAGLRAAADVAVGVRGVSGGGLPGRVPELVERCLAEVAEQQRILDGWDRPPASKLATAALALAEANRITGPEPDRWEAVASAFEAAVMSYPAAYAQYRAAEALLMRDGVRAATHGPAGELIRGAHRSAVALGAAPLAADLARLARQARVELDDATPDSDRVGAPVVARAHAGDGGRASDLHLSAREHEVLALIAAGRTNGQIALELFISPKTASVHVTHILDKLGATNRIEAAMIATRAGLLTASNTNPTHGQKTRTAKDQ
jgi:DNA-binding CsgD family transcriptional regulator/tetratricopeptide (TPR) repeat protein